MTPRDFELAEDYLLQAVAIDPHFAKAWVGLSIVMGFMASGTADQGEVAELMDKRRAYTARAVEADPDDPSALLQAGQAGRHGRRHRGGGRSICRAVERAPNDADILAVAAWFGPGARRDLAEANAWAERALALNPAAPAGTCSRRAPRPSGRATTRLRSGRSRPRPRDLPNARSFSRRRTPCSATTDAARAAADELRAMLPGFDLDLYVKTWPDPGLRQRLHDGAVRAGLGEKLVGN